MQLAKQQGDFLLVGLHADEDVEARRGPHTPIMNVHERALSVLASKYVDEVSQHSHLMVSAAAACGSIVYTTPPFQTFVMAALGCLGTCLCACHLSPVSVLALPGGVIVYGFV